MDFSLFASSLHGGNGWWLWKWWLVGLDGESWGGFVDYLVLVSMGFGAWLLRKCKKRNKKSNTNVSNFSSLRSVSLSLSNWWVSLSLSKICASLFLSLK